MVCQRAVTLIVDLCLHNSTLLDQDTCQDYLFLLSSQGSDQKESGKDSNLLPGACCSLQVSVLDSSSEMNQILKSLIFYIFMHLKAKHE